MNEWDSVVGWLLLTVVMLLAFVGLTALILKAMQIVERCA